MTTALTQERVKQLEAFDALMDEPERNENPMQAFMEANTHFVPTPIMLNHRVHMNSVIAKFPIGERSSDFAYLTKSSIEWQLVLIELEDSGKRIFKQSSKDHAFTAHFTDAVAQIGVWRDYLGEHTTWLREKLHPLLIPPQMARHRLTVKYVLVIGRSDEFEHHDARKLRLANFGDQNDLVIMTYDTIRRQVAAGHSDARAVLRANSRGYRLQSAEGMPSTMFAYMKPAELELSSTAEKALRKEGYDIDAWRQNKPLSFNEKWTLDSAPALYDHMHPAAKSIIKTARDKKAIRKSS